MTRPGRLFASLRRRPIWIAAGAMALLILFSLILASQRDWQRRAAMLERENMSLQLTDLSREINKITEQLEHRASDLANSDAVLRLIQENAVSGADRLEITNMARDGVDSLFILNLAHSPRFGVVVHGDQLSEQAPDSQSMHIAELMTPSVAPDSPARAQPMASFAADRWIVARPILTHTAPGITLGWVVLTRSLSPSVLASLGHSVSSSLALQPVEIGALPAAMRDPVPVLGTEPLVSTQFSNADADGYAILRDLSGKPARAFRLSRVGLAADSTAEQGNASRGARAMYYVVLMLLLLLAAAALVLATKRYFRRQRSVDARYKALIDQANDGIVIVDADSYQVLYTNPAFLNRLGYTNEEAQALTLSDIFTDETVTPEVVLSRLRSADSQMALNMQQRCKNGSFFDTEVRCNALDVDGRDVLAYVTHDVSLRRKAEQQLIENQQRLDRMAHHDQLTGLPNRHYLTAFLPEAIGEAKAANSMLGVVFLDLDRFKHINDTRGHETGDKLLQEVATRLSACVRDTDVVIRMGGDEFVVIFRNVKSYDEVTLGAARIVETLNQPIIIDRHPLQTTGSVGVSLYPRDGANMVELLKHSDTAMYQAKDRGRNNVQMFSHAMNRKLKHRVAVEASLREALRLKQLDVHYQPFVNLLTRKVVGLEALMRWSHPVHGMIPADQFIPVAEETGLIVPMGNFVLHRTLQTMSAWRKAGVALVPVSLNIAPAQLQRGELQSTIATLLKTHNLRPEMLQLEMTERAMFDSHAPAGENRQDTMARLRDLGIKIAIDDFGTGYSSLSYLKNWRVDALKIDRSFVRDLVTDSSDLAIVSAIIAIARHLHIQVIAEGIEAYQQAEILRRLGCSVGQGFLFARPMPADECLEFLRDNSGSALDEGEDMLAVFSAGRA
jgi:diguanylate cyclase (GGDEF)-like protein/PAS domain S-box-containing protein